MQAIRSQKEEREMIQIFMQRQCPYRSPKYRKGNDMFIGENFPSIFPKESRPSDSTLFFAKISITHDDVHKNLSQHVSRPRGPKALLH